MKLTEIGEQYNKWLVTQMQRLQKTCRRGQILALCLGITNLSCLGMLILPKHEALDILQVSFQAPASAISEDPEIRATILNNTTVNVSECTADLQLCIPSNMKGRYQILIYIEEKLFYKSDILYPGTNLPMIELSRKPEIGTHQGRIVVRDLVSERGATYQQKNITVICGGNNEQNEQPHVIEGGRG